MPTTEIPVIRGNYFAEGKYLKTDVRTGVMRNRAGTRMLALTSDFLLGLVSALNNECGPAATAVFRSCGRTWGKRVAERFATEMQEYYGMPLSDFPLSQFNACLYEMFNHHGWGKLELNLDQFTHGIIIATVQNPIYADLLGRAEQPADALLAGVLAGMFSYFAGQELDCLQTQCQACGHPDSKFLITVPERLKPVLDWPTRGKTHAQIVAEVQKTRA